MTKPSIPQPQKKLKYPNSGHADASVLHNQYWPLKMRVFQYYMMFPHHWCWTDDSKLVELFGTTIASLRSVRSRLRADGQLASNAGKDARGARRTEWRAVRGEVTPAQVTILRGVLPGHAFVATTKDAAPFEGDTSPAPEHSEPATQTKAPTPAKKAVAPDKELFNHYVSYQPWLDALTNYIASSPVAGKITARKVIATVCGITLKEAEVAGALDAFLVYEGWSGEFGTGVVVNTIKDLAYDAQPTGGVPATPKKTGYRHKYASHHEALLALFVEKYGEDEVVDFFYKDPTDHGGQVLLSPSEFEVDKARKNAVLNFTNRAHLAGNGEFSLHQVVDAYHEVITAMGPVGGNHKLWVEVDQQIFARVSQQAAA